MRIVVSNPFLWQGHRARETEESNLKQACLAIIQVLDAPSTCGLLTTSSDLFATIFSQPFISSLFYLRASIRALAISREHVVHPELQTIADVVLAHMVGFVERAAKDIVIPVTTDDYGAMSRILNLPG